MAASATIAAAGAAAGTPNPDAELLQLGVDADRLNAEWSGACDAADTAWNAYWASLPPPPTTLFITRQDAWDFGDGLAKCVGGVFKAEQLDRLRGRLPQLDAIHAAQGGLVPSAGGLAARIREIIAAYACHQRACQAPAYDFTRQAALEANESVEKLAEQLDAVEHRIIAAPAHTAAGWAVKARSVMQHYRESDEETWPEAHTREFLAQLVAAGEQGRA